MRNHDPVQVKYCEKGELKKQSLSNEEYGKIVRKFRVPGKPLDEILAPIVARILDTKGNRFYKMLEAVQRDRHDLYNTFRNGDTILVEI